jgi:membrane protein implicated in regulation of membrane protease activity
MWIPFLSIRFWTYAIGTFGVIGVLLSLVSRAQEPAIVTISGVTGFAMGLVAACAYRWAQKCQTSSAVSENDYVGTEAHVLVAARPGHPGKVRMSIRGDLIDMIAATEGDKSIEAGEEVLVVGLDGSQVRIARKEDILG